MPRHRHVLNWLTAGVTALSGPGAAWPAAAAEITASKLPEDPYALILIEGPISEGDDRRFAEAVEPYLGAPAMVILRSPGGSVSAALGIGERLHAAFFATIVLEDHACRAACALIWLAGVQRHMTATSAIMLSTTEAPGEGDESVATPMLEEYLRALDLPESAIRYATDMPAGDERPITPDIARSLGIPVWVYRDGQIIRPEEPVVMRPGEAELKER